MGVNGNLRPAALFRRAATCALEDQTPLGTGSEMKSLTQPGWLLRQFITYKSTSPVDGATVIVISREPRWSREKEIHEQAERDCRRLTGVEGGGHSYAKLG